MADDQDIDLDDVADDEFWFEIVEKSLDDA
jgi:hypothetical protein